MTTNTIASQSSDLQQTFAFIPQPKRWHRPVSWLLWLANSDAPNWRHHRFAFYRLKDRILSAHAVDDGLDWQRFTKPCWGCEGTGYYTHWSGDKDICFRCYGSGVYATYYVKLHRLAFGGRAFHRPGDSQNHEPETTREIIQGRVRHNRKGWRAVIAFAVLLAMFDRREMRRTAWVLTNKSGCRLASRVRRWLPVKCYECRCLMIRKDAGAMLTGRGGRTLGVLCGRCREEDAPF